MQSRKEVTIVKRIRFILKALNDTIKFLFNISHYMVPFIHSFDYVDLSYTM